jgi:threonine dehydratase
VTLPEKPGAFKAFCQTLGKRNITEFNYRYADARDAHVFVGVQLRNGDIERAELTGLLEKKGYPVLDLSDNEMANCISAIWSAVMLAWRMSICSALSFPSGPVP